jgi:hypothetical protein
MSAVQIAGCSGAGKSAIAAAIARRGLLSIDSDDDPFLARWVDPAGIVVAEEPAAPDWAWLARHGWAWDPARLNARRDYHDWGHIGDTREFLRRKLPALQERLRALGAIPIDASQPLDQVADAILARPLPLPPQARPGRQPGDPRHKYRLGISPVTGPGDAGVVGEHDGLNTITQAELHEQAGDVRLDCGFADDECGGDLSV